MREQLHDALVSGDQMRAEEAAPLGGAQGFDDVDLFRAVAERYVLEERLGGDDLSTVYRGLDRETQHQVAVRLFGTVQDAAFRARFHQLGAVLVELRHEAVATTLDYGIDRDRPYLVGELVTGGSLRQELDANGPLPPTRVRSVLDQLLGALDAAHAAGVLHLDLRPENVLLTRSGLVKLADLGLAGLPTIPADPLARSNRTPYLAPEQVVGDPPSPQTDLYALAALGYELLTGRTPFAGLEAFAALTRRLRHEPAPVRTIRPDAPLDLDNVLQRALSPNPHERFPSAAEFRAALTGAEWVEPTALVGEPADSCWPNFWIGAANRAAEPGKPGWVIAALVPMLATVLLLLGAYVGYTSVLPKLLGGSQIVSVPDFRGRSLDEARAVAGAYGLELLIDAVEPTKDQPKDTVVGQAPAPGRELRRGATLRLTLSAGVPMPTLAGKSVNEARLELIRGGWAVPKVEGRYLPDAPRGAVVDQRPAPGALAPDLSAATLVVSAENLAAAQPAWASSNAGSVIAVVDGDEATVWRAAKNDGEWVEVGLGTPRAIGGVEVVPEDGVVAPGEHEVWVWDTGGESRLVHTFRTDGTTRGPLFHHFDRPLDGIVKLRVLTVRSAAPTAWRELRILDQ